VKLPEKGGWRRKGVRMRGHRLGGLYLTHVVLANRQTTLKLRVAPEDDETGYNLLIAVIEPRVRLVQVQKGGDHSPPFEPMEDDSVRFIELAELIVEAASDLIRSRGSLREARIDGKALGEVEPAILVKRLVSKMAPVVTEIARHSLAPDELVLKRVVTDDRREEIFAPKADLLAKLDPVPLALRGVFAPLGLGDLGRAGAASGRAYGGNDGRGGHGRAERLDSEVTMETMELRSPPRAELAPMAALPGMTPMASAAMRPDGRMPSPAGSMARSGSPPGSNARASSPIQPPASARGNANGYGQGAATARLVEPPSGRRGPDEDEVTIVADGREKGRAPAMQPSSDSIDAALSELEHES